MSIEKTFLYAKYFKSFFLFRFESLLSNHVAHTTTCKFKIFYTSSLKLNSFSFRKHSTFFSEQHVQQGNSGSGRGTRRRPTCSEGKSPVGTSSTSTTRSCSCGGWCAGSGWSPCTTACWSPTTTSSACRSSCSSPSSPTSWLVASQSNCLRFVFGLLKVYFFPVQLFLFEVLAWKYFWDKVLFKRFAL